MKISNKYQSIQTARITKENTRIIHNCQVIDRFGLIHVMLGTVWDGVFYFTLLLG